MIVTDYNSTTHSHPITENNILIYIYQKQYFVHIPFIFSYPIVLKSSILSAVEPHRPTPPRTTCNLPRFGDKPKSANEAASHLPLGLASYDD